MTLSAGNIVAGALSLICQNIDRNPKIMTTPHGVGTHIEVWRCPTQPVLMQHIVAEVSFVSFIQILLYLTMGQIAAVCKEDKTEPKAVPFSEVAILYRQLAV